MGSGSYSTQCYASIASDRDYYSKSVDDIFDNSSITVANSTISLNANARIYNTQIDKKMLNTGVRECRDSNEHPLSTPIIIALDVTGSMLNIPYVLIKDYLPKIMDSIIQMGIPDPQLLFMAIGDVEYDNYPIQVGQFESDTVKIIDSLESLVLEGGGGGNSWESYELAHIIAGYHTETDSWFKRNTKGFLFTIGDEPNCPEISSNNLVKFLHYEKGVKPISAFTALEKAKEQYHVFHIHVKDASWGKRVSTINSWKQLLGDNLIVCETKDIIKEIPFAISKNYKLVQQEVENIIDEDEFFL